MLIACFRSIFSLSVFIFIKSGSNSKSFDTQYDLVPENVFHPLEGRRCFKKGVSAKEDIQQKFVFLLPNLLHQNAIPASTQNIKIKILSKSTCPTACVCVYFFQFAISVADPVFIFINIWPINQNFYPKQIWYPYLYGLNILHLLQA